MALIDGPQITPCPCACGCTDGDNPRGSCECVASNCPCVLFEAEVWHTPKLVMRQKFSTPTGLFAGACTCGWTSSGLESETNAWTSAKQHAKAKNDELMEAFNGSQPAPAVEGMPAVQGVQEPPQRPGGEAAVAGPEDRRQEAAAEPPRSG